MPELPGLRAAPALAACFVPAPFAEESPRELDRHRILARPVRARKEVGMGNPPRTEHAGEDRFRPFLSDDRVPAHRRPFDLEGMADPEVKNAVRQSLRKEPPFKNRLTSGLFLRIIHPQAEATRLNSSHIPLS